MKGLKLLLFALLLSGSLYGALTKTEVSMLYVTIFNRASEGSGNLYWQNNGLSMEATATAMLNTPDAKAYFGDSLSSNQAFVEHIYKNTLNKTYADDKIGIDYWVGLLNNGVSRGTVVKNLVIAATDPKNAGDAQEQFNNRVEISNYMADTIKNTPSDYAISTSFSNELIVTSDYSTVEYAKVYIKNNIMPISINDSIRIPNILKTGQTKSYDMNGNIVYDQSIKDDGYYQKGKSRNFSRDNDIVTDNVTGLMWQDDVDAGDINLPLSSQYDVQLATEYCENLTLGGFTDWRLPTIIELQTLVNYSKFNPSIHSIFQNIEKFHYWSSTKVKNLDRNWRIDFITGEINSGTRSLYSNIRCVREK